MQAERAFSENRLQRAKRREAGRKALAARRGKAPNLAPAASRLRYGNRALLLTYPQVWLAIGRVLVVVFPLWGGDVYVAR